MAAQPFNSVGGYTIGIPPQNFIDNNGNLNANTANISGNVFIGGVLTANGSIVANNFIGNIVGNVTGDFAVTGPNTGVVYNKNGTVFSDANLTFNYDTRVLTANGKLIINSLQMGVGPLEFSNSIVFRATTNSASVDQVLFTIPANTISTVDYIVIATDTVANTRQTSKLIASILGDDVGYYEYGTIDMNGGVGDFKVKNESGNIIFTVTPLTSNEIQYKIMITSITEG